jgi:DNA-binding CsgD family transcriptional regulator
MAASAARLTEGRHGADVGGLAAFDLALAQAGDAPAAFAALVAHGAAIGLEALAGRWDRGDGASSEDFLALPEPASALFADPAFRRAWPIERAALAAALPLRWKIQGWPGDHGVAARSAMARLSAAGVEAGITLAARGPRGQTLLLTALGRAARLSALAAVDLDLWAVAAARVLARLGELTAAPPRSPGLSRREAEILRLSAEGLTAVAMARTLGVTEATIKFHLSGARRKLGVKNTAEAVAKIRSLREGDG